MPPVDKEMLKKERIVTREYRNRKLGGFLKELKLTEGRGTGLPIIYNSLEVNGSPPPVFETDDDRSYFLSVIKIHPLARQIESQRAKDRAKDNELKISTISDIDDCLRSLDDQRRAQVESEIRNKLDKITLNILVYSTKPKTRIEIFNCIKLYNNSKNFNRHISPMIEIGWLQLTIPDKPTSKHQKYVTSDVGKRLVEPQKTDIEKTTVASSNIASVKYDAENIILEVEFHHGAIYRYFGVPNEEYEAIMNASSLDSYFYHNIRENFESEKI